MSSELISRPESEKLLHGSVLATKQKVTELMTVHVS